MNLNRRINLHTALGAAVGLALIVALFLWGSTRLFAPEFDNTAMECMKEVGFAAPHCPGSLPEWTLDTPRKMG